MNKYSTGTVEVLFIKTESWLLLIFLICLHNPVGSLPPVTFLIVKLFKQGVSPNNA